MPQRREALGLDVLTRILPQIAEAPPNHDPPREWGALPGDDLEQAGLAGSVAPHHAGLVAPAERERQAVEDGQARDLDGQISKDGFGREYKPLEERLQQLEDRIPEVQGELDFLKIQRLSSDEVLSEARDLYSRWPELEREEKRRIVEAITDRITIGRDEVHIDLAYLPSPSEELATKARTLCR